MLSSASASVLKMITTYIIPNITEINLTNKRVSTMWITNDKIVSRDNKQTILQGANLKRTTQSTSKEDTITSKY